VELEEFEDFVAAEVPALLHRQVLELMDPWPGI